MKKARTKGKILLALWIIAVVLSNVLCLFEFIKSPLAENVVYILMVWNFVIAMAASYFFISTNEPVDEDKEEKVKKKK